MNIAAAKCPQCGGTDQAYFPEDGEVCWNCWKDNQETHYSIDADGQLEKVER